MEGRLITTAPQLLLQGLTLYNAASALLVACSMYWVKGILFPKKKSSKRRISFTSAGMAMGSWPEKSKMCDPVINVVLTFDECPTEDDMMKEAVDVMLQYERCAGIPVGTKGKNDWEFKLCENLNKAKLLRKFEISGSEDDLYQFIAEHMRDDLRNGRDGLPWWEYLLISNSGTGKSAIVLRLEHCIADGLSLVHLFENIITYADGSEMISLIPDKMRKKFHLKDSKLTLLRKTVTSSLEALTLPSSKFDDPLYFRRGTSQEMIYTNKRKPVIFPVVTLDFIFQLKNAAKVTVNDVFLACLSQALHDYCIHHDDELLKKKACESLQFRCLMPIAFPRTKAEVEDKSRTLNNKWVFISADMGIGHKNIRDRLAFVHNYMNKLKQSPLAYCTRKIQESLGPKLPYSVSKQTVFDSFCRHSLVFSNVPGPTKQCLFAKQKVLGCQMLFNNLIPQVGILTYHHQVFMNMIVDYEIVTESHLIPIFYCRALRDLGQEYNIAVPQNITNHCEN